MTTYHLSSSPSDRINFDQAIDREVDEMFRMDEYSDDLLRPGAQMAQFAWDNFAIGVEQDAIVVDDLDEAKARYLNRFAAAWDAKQQEGCHIDAAALAVAETAGYNLTCERCLADLAPEPRDEGSGEYIPCPHCGYRHYAEGGRFERPETDLDVDARELAREIQREHAKRLHTYRVTFGEFSTGYYDPEAFVPSDDDSHEVAAASARDALDVVILERCQPPSSFDQESGRQYTWWACWDREDWARIDEIA